MFLFSRKNRQLLGLDITTSSIKLIELANSGGRFVVESYAAEATPANSMNEKTLVDPQAVGEAIRRAVKRSGATSTEVAIAISGDAAITKVIQMPKGLRDADLEAQVEMQADQYIPFPMDEVSYDFEVLGPSEKDADSVDIVTRSSQPVSMALPSMLALRPLLRRVSTRLRVTAIESADVEYVELEAEAVTWVRISRGMSNFPVASSAVHVAVAPLPVAVMMI